MRTTLRGLLVHRLYDARWQLQSLLRRARGSGVGGQRDGVCYQSYDSTSSAPSNSDMIWTL